MQDPIYARLTEQKRPSLFAASGFVLLATAGLWLSSLLELVLPQGASGLVLNAAYYLPFVLLPMLLYARRNPGIGDAMRLNPPPALQLLAPVLLGIASVYLASALSALWEYGLDALGLRGLSGVSLPQTERELMLMIVSTAALPAICEELLFRGFILSAWESRGTAYAIAVTSVLFALLHGNLYGLPAYLLVGAVSGYITFALDSVYAGIIYHTVYNAACLAIPYLLIDSGEAAGSAEVAVSASMLLSVALDFFMIMSMTAMLLIALRFRAKNLGIEPIPRIRRPLGGREKAMLLAAVAALVASIAMVQLLILHA